MSNINKQNGTVLILALLLLFVMTLIGVSSMTTSTMEERMAGNTRNRHLALQAAEAAMVDAEDFIRLNVSTISPFNGSNGLYALGNGPTPQDAFTAAWWVGAASVPYSKALPKDVNALPLYTIEHRGLLPKTDKSKAITIASGYDPTRKTVQIETFRVTARGTGLTANSVVILQSHWGQRFN